MLSVALTELSGNMVYDCRTFVVKAADWTCHGSCPPTLPTRTPACTSTGWGQGLCGSGALSLMPKNYFRGMRRDVIEKLAERGIKVLR